ncbi:MAG: zinc-binding dehydrogenase [Candidatus Competibacteraceae bacterium]|jgi:NADPH2:quinone reductase|nr:zinc-binding dehydrogenase [Candidatus Competibacteraceae bacterium]
MKAMVIEKFGAPDVFGLTEMESPKLSPGHAIVKVMASSVNQIDCKMRSGAVPAITPPFPAVIHSDIAGVITEVADDVKQFSVGDEIYGCSGGISAVSGALCETMLVDVDTIAKKPTSLTMAEAASLPLVTITAWDALFNKAKPLAGQDVLVHGGLGGVGHIGVQLAAHAGAHVYTTVGNDTEFAEAQAFGAKAAINYKTESTADYVALLTGSKGFDLVFDTVGGPNLENSFAAAKLYGEIVTTAARITLDLSPMHLKSLSLHVVFMLLPLITGQGRTLYHNVLSEAATLVNQEKLRPLIDATQFTFSKVGDAHAYLESGQASGKVVLVNDLHG